MLRDEVQSVFAEQATGCYEHPAGLGSVYDRHGQAISWEAAQDIFLERFDAIEVPNAGAGSYRKVFQALNYTEVELLESSSSAGDWTFMAFDGCYWDVVFQTNRYPRHGFSYSRHMDLIGFTDKDRLLQVYVAYCGG